METGLVIQVILNVGGLKGGALGSSEWGREDPGGRFQRTQKWLPEGEDF